MCSESSFFFPVPRSHGNLCLLSCTVLSLQQDSAMPLLKTLSTSHFVIRYLNIKNRDPMKNVRSINSQLPILTTDNQVTTKEVRQPTRKPTEE